jgi:hypothetical protein
VRRAGRTVAAAVVLARDHGAPPAHTGGIRNHVAVPSLVAGFTGNLFFVGAPDKAGLLAQFFALPREFAPGATWRATGSPSC